MMDSSKPLTILNHVGGNPLLFVASRSKDNVEDYDAGRRLAEADGEARRADRRDEGRSRRLGQVSEVSRPRHRAAASDRTRRTASIFIRRWRMTRARS